MVRWDPAVAGLVLVGNDTLGCDSQYGALTQSIATQRQAGGARRWSCQSELVSKLLDAIEHSVPSRANLRVIVGNDTGR